MIICKLVEGAYKVIEPRGLPVRAQKVHGRSHDDELLNQLGVQEGAIFVVMVGANGMAVKTIKLNALLRSCAFVGNRFGLAADAEQAPTVVLPNPEHQVNRGDVWNGRSHVGAMINAGACRNIQQPRNGLPAIIEVRIQSGVWVRVFERPQGQAFPQLGCSHVADQQCRVEFELAQKVMVARLYANAVKDLVAGG
ncbi:hypothetical protein [Aquabacterium parvum]|jgi:hypothetical protein|uniref:hypothetical protein n=1 Tax=Aquabacterium parvum TaxID=70584 RepID=UPI00128F5F91|nr:hypothetical protein [Aquabacterium parvum]MBU0918052.1 hypothetical protein [Gammaproteobacteria bacterium]